MSIVNMYLCITYIAACTWLGPRETLEKHWSKQSVGFCLATNFWKQRIETKQWKNEQLLRQVLHVSSSITAAIWQKQRCLAFGGVQARYPLKNVYWDPAVLELRIWPITPISSSFLPGSIQHCIGSSIFTRPGQIDLLLWFGWFS